MCVMQQDALFSNMRRIKVAESILKNDYSTRSIKFQLPLGSSLNCSAIKNKTGSFSTFCFFQGDLSKLLYLVLSSSTTFNVLGRTSELQLYPILPAVHSNELCC